MGGSCAAPFSPTVPYSRRAPPASLPPPTPLPHSPGHAARTYHTQIHRHKHTHIDSQTYPPPVPPNAHNQADETLRLWNLAALLVAEDSGETNVNEREETHRGNGAGSPAAKRKISVELKSYGGSVKCCCFNASGTLLCSGSGDNLVRVWRMRDRVCLHTLKGHKNWVLAVACSPVDQGQLASGSADGTVRVWSLESAPSQPSQSASATVLKPPKAQGVGLGASRDMTAVAYHPLGNLLCTAGADKLVRIWTLPDGSCQHVLQGHRGHINAIAFQGGTGRVVASVEGSGLGLQYFSSDNSLILWDLEAPVGAEMIVRLCGHKRRVNCCAFNGSGALVVTGGNDNSVRLWVLSEPLAQLGPGEEGRLRRPDDHHSCQRHAGLPRLPSFARCGARPLLPRGPRALASEVTATDVSAVGAGARGGGAGVLELGWGGDSASESGSTTASVTQSGARTQSGGTHKEPFLGGAQDLDICEIEEVSEASGVRVRGGVGAGGGPKVLCVRARARTRAQRDTQCNTRRENSCCPDDQRAHARAQRTYKRNASVPTLSLPCPPGTRQTASASSSRTASSSVLGERDRRVRGASQGEDGGGADTQRRGEWRDTGDAASGSDSEASVSASERSEETGPHWVQVRPPVRVEARILGLLLSVRACADARARSSSL